MKKFSEMKNWDTLVLLAFVAAVVVLVVFKYSSRSFGSSVLPEPDMGGVACTMEAKICPDGSAVGRQGPNCEFAPCPGE